MENSDNIILFFVSFPVFFVLFLYLWINLSTDNETKISSRQILKPSEVERNVEHVSAKRKKPYVENMADIS